MRIEAESLGAGAAEILGNNAAGEVEVVFSRSLYVRFPTGLVCIGDAAIGHGPLNLPSHIPAMFNWQGATRPGVLARYARSSIDIGQLQISLDNAEIWTPLQPPVWCRTTVRSGMDHLRALVPSDIPDGGLGSLLSHCDSCAPFNDQVLRRAVPAIEALMLWVASEPLAEPPEAILDCLLGLGPGLTPSGDDFLSGAVASLRMAGRSDKADRLGRVIERLGPHRTNEISLAHMRAAIRFGLGDKLHQVAVGIFQANYDALRASLARLAEVEHHSSWDSLAGIAYTLDALLGREKSEPGSVRTGNSGPLLKE